MKKIDSKVATKHAKAAFNTFIWSVFLLAGAFGSLALRGNIHLSPESEKMVGSILASFVLYILFTIVYKANFERK